MYFRSPQWSDNEQLCARNVTNEVHCFEGGAPGYVLNVVDSLQKNTCTEMRKTPL